MRGAVVRYALMKSYLKIKRTIILYHIIILYVQKNNKRQSIAKSLFLFTKTVVCKYIVLYMPCGNDVRYI